MQLKILSWNIWYDGRFDEVSRFLTSFNADIIGAQEIVPDDPARDIIGLLMRLGYKYVIAPVLTIEKDGRTMSNAVFSKYPIISHKIYALSEINKRIALRADVKIGEKTLHAFSTHLLHTHQQPSGIQEVQAYNLLKIIPSDYTIIMGDFNATSDSAVIQRMREAMIDSDSASTPTLNTKLFDCLKCDSRKISDTRLDYIFTSKDIRAHSFNVHNAAGSDHLPISAIIEI